MEWGGLGDSVRVFYECAGSGPALHRQLKSPCEGSGAEVRHAAVSGEVLPARLIAIGSLLLFSCDNMHQYLSSS
jgi:hypothetical protein